MTWKQYRKVEVRDEIAIEDLDMQIRVRKPKEDPLEFDVRVYNLARGTWERISKGDRVSIELGWEDGPSGPVILGEIEHRTPSPRGGDMEYRIKGTDRSSKQTKGRISGTWQNRRPDEVASDMARSMDLTPVTDNAERPIRGCWGATANERVRTHLDELLDYAQEFTGVSWEWFAEEGRLYFVRRDRETIDAPSLRYGENALALQESDSPDENADRQFDFEMMLDPRLKVGAVVYAETETYTGALKVVDYEYRSSTESGDHLVQGKMVPASTKFVLEEQIYEMRDAFRGLLEDIQS